MFFLQCEHLFTPSNFTLAARLFATSEGMLYSLYGGFFRTDVPSSHYSLPLPGDRPDKSFVTAIRSNSTVFVFVIDH